MLNIRRGKQSSIPHGRILQLAMDSRTARIERERLRRQSHLVRARTEELSTQLTELKARPVLVSLCTLFPLLPLMRLTQTSTPTDTPHTLHHLNRGVIVVLLLLP